MSATMLGAAFQRSGLRSDRRQRGGPAARARCRSTVRSSRATPSASRFVSGDLQLGGTGTVTHIDGDRVYAFGHPMYNLGPTEFPMTRAYVYTVLPSLFSSIEAVDHRRGDRHASAGPRHGDRRPARPGPAHDSGHAHARIGARRATRTFNFGVVKDQLFTPLMTYAALVNTLLSYERQFGTATFAVTGTATVKDHDAVDVRQPLLGRTRASIERRRRTSSRRSPRSMGNDYEKVEIERLELTIETSEEPRTATLERVWIDDPRPRAGRTVPLKVLLRTYRGEDVLRTVPIEIPANAQRQPVGAGVRRRSGWPGRAARSARRRSRAASTQLIERSTRPAGTTRSTSSCSSGDAGAVVNGELLSSLPPSVLAVLEADRSGGNFNPLHSATLGEWELPTEHAVSGRRGR